MSADKKNKKSLILAATAVLALSGGALFTYAEHGVAEEVKAEKKDEAAPAEAAAAPAPAEIKAGNPIVANVEGKDILRSDVFTFIANLPEQTRQLPIQNLFPLALEQVVNNEIVTKKADGAKLEADEEVTKLMEQAKAQIVRSVYLDREIDKEITQKKLLKEYEALLDKLGDIEESKARHILVDSEDKAKEIIAKLDGGAKFDDVYKENVPEGQPNKGGELGWFAKTEMVPEFADAAFALKKGEYSKTPIKTQFGWHVVQIEDRRKRPEPEFEAVKPQLEAQMRQKVLGDMLTKWQKDSKIKKFDINGEPVKSN